MSVSILLIPAIIAAAAGSAGAGTAGALTALAARGGTGGAHALSVSTRMRDVGLLCAALGDLGAVVHTQDTDVVRATIADLSVDLGRGADGVWSAHIDARRTIAVEEANSLMLALDGAYAARVQQAVAERIRQNAGSAGFDLVSEQVDEDRSVRMVLQVRDGGSGR